MSPHSRQCDLKPSFFRACLPKSDSGLILRHFEQIFTRSYYPISAGQAANPVILTALYGLVTAKTLRTDDLTQVDSFNSSRVVVVCRGCS